MTHTSVTSYKVLIDDNAHYRDEGERRDHGEYANYAEALVAARAIVDDFLNRHRAQYDEACALFNAYCHYGDDPFIVPDSGDDRFSARNYARDRCYRLIPAAPKGTPDE
jgi:hypothetical protein